MDFFLKRMLDIFAAALGILLLSPLLLILAVLVRWKLGSPVIFKQERPGYRGKPFHIYKFRTMTNETDASGNLLPREVRLTPFGKKLRSTSLDELPELFNVLFGSMSLVGPRPLRMEYLPLYTAEQRKRHDALPGITGWAQINGRNAITWEKKFEYDVWYVQHHSFFLDLKIIFLTFLKVIQREGADNLSSEMGIFRGTPSPAAQESLTRSASDTSLESVKGDS